MVVVVLLLIPGDAVGVVPVPGEVEREEAAPHQVARHPQTTADTVVAVVLLSIKAATERGT